MRIELQFERFLIPEGNVIRTYDPEEDDVRSILMDVCRILEHKGRFVVSGFGQARWPVDVGTDLPVLLEQLPDALRAVVDGAGAVIDFYEQGVERVIALTPSNGRYEASCSSQTNWQPNPAIEYIERENLESMLVAVRDEFMRAFTEVAPELLQHPWVRNWQDCLPE